MHYQCHPLPAGLDLAALCQSNPARYPCLLASSASSEVNGRYDILLALPQYELRLDANYVLSSNADFKPDLNAGFLHALDQCWQQERIDETDVSPLPFTGGWFVYLSYELAAEVEPCLKLPPVPAAVPVAVAQRCPLAVIYDRQEKSCYAVVENKFHHLLAVLHADIAQLGGQTPVSPAAITLQDLKEDDEAPYLQQVARIRQYIIDGDIFQANLSRRWQLKIDPAITDAALFAHLSKSNPGGFAAMCRLRDVSVLSSSPERLVSVRNGLVQTRPIAGTRPRSENTARDNALADELLEHPKEQAEHIMLIDLERNDLGRICVPGSIEVNEMMSLETYQHVHHIVSNVRGRLRSEITPAAVIRAVFPGGTITGCPKVRCMEILAEMEQCPRAAYTGSLGYLNRDGSMDLNILIRTMMRQGRDINLRAGGGIVADSDARAELAETRAKAKGLLAAFEPVNSLCSV